MRTPITVYRHTSLLRIARRQYTTKGSVSSTGSAKLFADAAKEEEEEQTQPRAQSPTLQLLEDQHRNWDGDEPIQDAVLRMLVDKHKPLRTGRIESADTKIKQRMQNQSFQPWRLSPLEPTPRAAENQVILPGIEGHRPWMTEYTAPTHSVASIRTGDVHRISSGRSATVSHPVDERARKLQIESKKRTERVTRITRAKDLSIDYKLGGSSSSSSSDAQTQARPNPVSLRGWTSLIEDKIEKARLSGVFNNVKGRGKPLQARQEEFNPFIGKEEFLMNRIVQRNGAAPPWVEQQQEMDSAVTVFRDILRQAWTRRAVLILADRHQLTNINAEYLSQFRDAEWMQSQRSYHEAAITEVNAQVRKYNVLAPASVRRGFYMVDVELQKAFEDAVPEIIRLLQQRSTKNTTQVKASNVEATLATISIWEMIQQMFRRFFGLI